MASIKTPTQLRKEHPDWTNEQVTETFNGSLMRKIKGVRKDLQGIKDILDTDPMWERDRWAMVYSEFVRRAISLLNPDFTDFLDFDNEDNATPEQEELMAQFFSEGLKKHD